MDKDLLIRRHRPSDGNFGCECWLLGVYPPDQVTPILPITNHPKHLGGDVSYGGVTYIAYPCSAVPADSSGDYALPEATIRISNVLRALVPSLAAHDYYRGYAVRIIAYNDQEPDADYTDQTSELLWVKHKLDGQDIIVTLGIPGELMDPVPEDIVNCLNCRHRFRISAGVYGKRCGYLPLPIIEIQKPSGSPVVVRMVGCLPMAGQTIEISGTGGLTPTLNGVYTATAVPGDVWNLTLDDTDGADYPGTWDGLGAGGFFSCRHTRTHCLPRGQLDRFGALSGQRTDSLRVAV